MANKKTDKCLKCNWSWANLGAIESIEKGHCYMFRKKMNSCQQFFPIPKKDKALPA